jgi:nitroreductase
VMDTFLAIASKREVREYSDRPIPEEVVRRILEAGRITGSSPNKQPWLFIVVQDRKRIEQLAELVYVPGNVLDAKLIVAIAATGKGPTGFDVGRAAQDMKLAAWNEGVGSCPNGTKDSVKASELLELGDDEHLVIILTFGYPARPRDPESRTPEQWIERANRKPLEEVSRTV